LIGFIVRGVRFRLGQAISQRLILGPLRNRLGLTTFLLRLEFVKMTIFRHVNGPEIGRIIGWDGRRPKETTVQGTIGRDAFARIPFE
jgi:hypothetical protein